jgi:hypothetical protein
MLGKKVEMNKSIAVEPFSAQIRKQSIHRFNSITKSAAKKFSNLVLPIYEKPNNSSPVSTRNKDSTLTLSE